MSKIPDKLESLQQKLKGSLAKLKFDELEDQKIALSSEVSSPTIWSDPVKAQQLNKKLADISRRLKPWEDLKSSIDEIVEMYKLEDKDLESDLEDQTDIAIREFEKLKGDLKFNDVYDDRNVIVSLYAGAGGTDAQDWTQMLFRMYIRWAESKDYKTKVISESPGEETGLKSITFEIEGDYLYGKLKGEHGVHRLVRLSPFNADHLRQTSFAKVEVLPMINNQEDIDLDDKDIRIDVYRSSGHGGQSVNTTDSAVRVTHIPTGIVVAIQNERSQLQNKDVAMTILRSKLAQLQLEQHQNKISELKGPLQSAEWGNQIRSYVLHPYKQVKDLRTKYETSNAETVLDGGLDPLIDAYIDFNIGN